MGRIWDPDKVLEVWQFVDKSLSFRNRAGRIIISNEDGDWHSDRFNGVLSGRGLVGEGPVIDVLLVALNLEVLELSVENLKRYGLSKIDAVLDCITELLRTIGTDVLVICCPCDTAVPVDS